MSRTDDIEAIYPLSPMQHAMLLRSQLAPGSGVYILQLSFEISGAFDAVAFRRAWEQVTERHAAHRTCFLRLDQEQPLQVVRRTVSVPWREEDWTSLPFDEQEARFAALLEQDRAEDFVPARAPLMRCVLVRTASDRHRFLWTRHHAISDGWSMPTVLSEVVQCYRAIGEGSTPQLGPATQYRDYIAWLRTQDPAGTEEYWRRSLAGVTGPTLLGVGRPRTEGGPSQGLHGKRRVLLSQESTSTLLAAARRERITLSTYIQAAWALLLRCYSGERDVLLGMVASGRPPTLAGVESAVGCFLNTLPVRVQVDDDALVTDWLRALQSAQVAREEHGHVSLAQIRRWAGLPGDQPLMESLVVFENFPGGPALAAQGGALHVENVRMAEQTSFPLTLTVAPGEHLSLQLSYDQGKFEEEAVERMLGHYEALLVSLASPPARVGDLTAVGPAEQATLLAQSAGPQLELPIAGAGGVHRLFEAQAAATPHATAVVVDEERLSYAELDARANRIAARLHRAGVVAGAFVGVCLERAAYLPAALLAVWKTGAAYLPLDSAYPAARIRHILDDAAPTVVLAQDSTSGVLAGSACPVLSLDATGDDLPSAADDTPFAPADADADAAALTIYTSGSTGIPKGVLITHRNVRALLAWASGTYSAEELSGTLASTSICFDLSVFELFLPLTTGGTVILARNALLLPSLPARGEVTLINTVPSALDTLLRLGALPPRVAVVNLAGEPLPEELVDRAYRQPGLRKVYNLYGPSEDTVYSTFALIPAGGGKPLIGRPVANSQAYVLDARLRPVPTGVAGELYLGGEGVSRGYHERPSLTASRYLPDPLSGRPGARLYRTGDLVRRLADGQLEYLGRTDHQVKLRGFRIELGEIEATLRALPGVRDAVAAVHTDPQSGKRLVAYVVDEPGLAFDQSGLVRVLRAVLPEHMVPSAFVGLAAIPLTPNGKVDRGALRAPESLGVRRTYREPTSETERVIAAVWTAVLGIPRPGVDDGFFDLGGDSLLLARVFGELKVRFPGGLLMTDLFRFPTIAELARHIEGGGRPGFADVQSRLERRKAAQLAAPRGGAAS